MAIAVVGAARAAGLRICLLHSAYLRPSGVDPDVAPGQRCFIDDDPSEFLARHRVLESWVNELGDPAVTLGIALHSTRTVPADQLASLASQTSGPLHIHVNEQRREIDECHTEYGRRPLALIDTAGALSARTTLIHMTHATDDELDKVAASGAGICFCPSTERDLGDGIGPNGGAALRNIPLSIGSDSQTQIDPMAELRMLEGHERLRRERRLVLKPPDGMSTGAYLLDVGTRGGARALGLQTGTIEPGAWADLVAVALHDPDLVGVAAGNLPEVLVFSSSSRAVHSTWVAGRPLG
jgi:formimidoylglutamate deiminase